VTELDTNPWLFNCLNGTIDLQTGQLLPHRKEDLITVIVPTEYHPDAQYPRWLSFLDRVTGGDSDLVAYLQRGIGYSLTGDTRSQVIFLLYGLGNNGKSTFTMTIRRLMAAYAERLDADDLMVKDRKLGGGPKEGIANLRNKRYVVGSELQDGKRLDVSLVKDMTGGETVKARRLYEHDVEFMPSFKLWLYGNHKPVIADSTLSIWRRVKQIPFDVTIPASEVDPDLPSKLEAELPGILAWAVKGCLDWQRYGLKEPEVVTTATASYRHEQDILGDFLEDCCILEPLATIPKSELKDEYQKWCQDNSVESVTQKTFRARLVEKGIGEGRIGKARYWRGIRLRTDADGDFSSDKSDKTFDNSRSKVTKGTDFPVKSPIKEKQKDFIENSVINVTNVTNSGELPDCPACGRNEWTYSPSGELLCPCGKSLKDGGR
jgi:putative DNA primase/helicase